MAATLPRLAGIGLTVAASALSLAATAAATPAPGPSTPHIVGGQPASTDDHPWMVSLTLNGGKWCGGTLVTPNKVITAAHCTQGYQASDFGVIAGRTDLRTTKGTTAKVTKLWQHPNFKAAESGDDVSVFTLDKKLDYKPLPLVDAGDSKLYAEGTKVTTLGWGDIKENGPDSPTLRQVQVPVTSDKTCSAAYPDSPEKYLPEKMVCAGVPEGGKDSCQGDSGGPLTTGGKLVGIVSWGHGCAQPKVPGIYTRLITYLDDVQKQINS